MPAPPRSNPPPLTHWRTLHADGFQGSRALVTGGAGFIGSHLCRALLDLGASVIVLDDLSGGSRANLPDSSQIEFVQGSLLDADLLRRCADGAHYIFHQAAVGSVPRSLEQPRLYHEVNATGTLNVLEAARSAGVRRVMFAASSSAYGDSPTLPKVETMPALPRSPYAASKVAGESLMQAFSASYGLETVSLRYFNIFGPRQNPNSAYAAVIAAFATALLAGRPPIIFGDGEQSRDFTHVDNAVHANLLAARAPAPLAGQVINVACGARITLNELARTLSRLAGWPELAPQHCPERPGDVKHSLADLTRARAVLNYSPLVPFETGLEQTLTWYKAAAER